MVGESERRKRVRQQTRIVDLSGLVDTIPAARRAGDLISPLPMRFGATEAKALPQSWRSQTGEGGDVANVTNAAHEVFLISGDLCGVSVSTMTMRPRLQTGHSRNEDPVSCSCWSR